MNEYEENGTQLNACLRSLYTAKTASVRERLRVKEWLKLVWTSCTIRPYLRKHVFLSNGNNHGF